MQRRMLILLIISLALILFASALYFYAFFVVLEEQHVPVDLQVDEILGFNLDTDAIHLGRVMAPGHSERGISLSHDKPYTVYAYIYMSGNVSPFIYVDEPIVAIPPGDTSRVNFYSQVPRGTAFGNYSGVVRVVFKRMRI